MLSKISDFCEGKISVEDAEKRIDDSSYRAMFFRDVYLKKGLHLVQEKGGDESPPLGDDGFEPPTPSLSSTPHSRLSATLPLGNFHPPRL